MSSLRQPNVLNMMASRLLVRPRPFPFDADSFRVIPTGGSIGIVPIISCTKYFSNIVMASIHHDSEHDSIYPNCSLHVHEPSDRNHSLCSDEELETLGGSTKVNSPGTAWADTHPEMQKIIWGSGNRNLGVGSNPPVDWPRDLAHSVPNIRDLVGINASQIVEPVLEGESKDQNGKNSSTSIQDDKPSKRSLKKAARNEQRKATRKAAKHRNSRELRPVQESRFHEDGLPTCLSSSSDDDLVSGQPLPYPTVNRTQKRSLTSVGFRSSSHIEASKELSKPQKQPFTTQARIEDVEAVRTEGVSLMDSSEPAQAAETLITNDTAMAPTPQNENQSQPQQKKEKKPKALKQPSTPTALPLSPALIDLRVGHILRCIPHENADSLYVSTIAMGDAEGTENTHKDEETGRTVRTVCSGLRGLIPIEQMQDRKVIVMANLKPVTMRGIKSAAMVLAASPPLEEGEGSHSADRVVELVTPPEGSEGGDKVYFEGWEYGEGKGPEKVLNPKKKQWEAVQPGLYTSDDLTVVFDAERVQGVEGGKGELVVEGREGKCKVPTLKGARLS